MIQLTKIVVSCPALPCQLDMWDVAGEYYYFRYRHGFGYIAKGDVDGDRVFEWEGEHYLDGVLDEDQIGEILSIAGFEITEETELVSFAQLDWSDMTWDSSFLDDIIAKQNDGEEE